LKYNTLSTTKAIDEVGTALAPPVLILVPLAVLFTLVTEVPLIKTDLSVIRLELHETEELLNTVAEASKNLIRTASQPTELVDVTVDRPSCKSAVEYFALLYFH
jgi:hypothetical protein